MQLAASELISEKIVLMSVKGSESDDQVQRSTSKQIPESGGGLFIYNLTKTFFIKGQK